MAIVSLPLATRPLLIGGKKSLDTDEEKPDPALLAKKPVAAPPPGANTPPSVTKPSAVNKQPPAAAQPPGANTSPPVAKPPVANTPPVTNTPLVATTPPVIKPSAAQNSAAAAQLATLPAWLTGQPAKNPASSGAANSPLIPLRPGAPASNAAPKPVVIPLRPEAASAGKPTQQQQPPTAPAPDQQPAASAQIPAPGQQAAAAPQPTGTPLSSTPAAGQQPNGTQPAPAPQPAGTPPPAASATQAAPAGRAAAAAAAQQAQPRGISANARGDGAAAVKMQSDIAKGKIIKDGKVAQHPDKSGDVYQAGFTHPTFTDDAKKGTTIPYRDDHGKVHQIGVQDMRRTTDPAGNASYSFKVNGKNISVPEDSKAPLFQIDPKDGRRFTTAADGTRRELGYDKKTAAQVGIAPREQARNEAREKLLTQGAALSRQLQDKQAQATAAQQRMDAAKQKYDNPGNATDAERQANYNELMGAFDAHNSLTSEVQTLQKQHDDHYQNIVRDQRARQAEIDQYKAAAAENPEDEQWLKDSRHTRGDTRHTDADLIAEAEKRDPATAAAMRRALASQPAQRTLAAAQSAFGKNGTAAGRPAAGNTMTLQDMLMHAPEMKQGGWSPVNQADAARATAQGAFGITDPENVHVAPSASGGYSLSRKTAGGGAGQPFATMDEHTGHITLLPGPDGRYSKAAQDFAASSTPGSAPIFLGKGTPLTEAERSALIAKGQQAGSAAKDRQGADAALTAAGLSPEGIQKLRNEGRLSVQDANFLNNKFNSGVSSYAQRDALNTAQKQNAGLQQMYQDTRAPADKPNFKSWMEKGDPQRDAQVQAKAKELGLSEDAVRQAMEDQRRTDFATPLTQQGSDQQSGFVNGLRRGIGFSGHDQDTTRTLTDGSLAVNPALTDDKAKFEKAIQDSNASPEAKAAALKSWPAQHDAWLTQATNTLKASKTLPGVEDYNAWLTKNTRAGHFSQIQSDGSVRQYTDNEKTQLYLDAMKNRSGVRKFMDNVSTSLVAGGGQVVSGLLGAAALAGNSFQDLTGVNVGGEAVSEAAAGMAQQNQALLQPHELTGTVEGTKSRFLSNLIQAVPSVGAAIATGGTAGLILGAVQSAGGTYTDLLQNHIIAGDSIEEAHKKAAGTAIASGAVSLALSKVMPGGAQALNNPATRQAAQKAFSATVKSATKGGAEEFSQEAIDSAFTHIASEMNKGRTFEQAATSFAEQFPQDALTSALLGGGVQAMADKKNGGAPPPQSTQPQPAQVAQPAPSQQTSPAQQPAPANPPASAQQSSPVQQPTPANPQQQIPLPTTPNNPAPLSGKPTPSASAQQPQTTATDRQPSPAPPSGQPAQTSANPSGQQSSTTVNNGQPPPTSPSLPPPTTAPKSPEQSQRLVNNVMNRPPEQRGHPQIQSDVAQAQSVLQDHVQKLENQKAPLSDAQKKELADAKATLSRLPAEKPANTPDSIQKTPPTDTQPAAHTQPPKTATRPADAARPSEATPENVQHPESANRPQAEAPEGATRSHGEVDADAPPAAVDLNRAPHTDPDAEAPRRRGDSDEQTHPAETQPDGSRPTRTLPGDAALPHRYDSAPTPPSSRNSPDGRSLEPSYPSPARNSSPAINATDTTPYHPATSADSQPATNSQLAGRTANGNTPDQPQNAAANPSARPTDNSRPPSPNTPGILPAPTASGSPSSPPSRTSLPPPRTPPLSPEQSQRLIDNVEKMPEKAQQHPQVQADVAQARSVVAGAKSSEPLPTIHRPQFKQKASFTAGAGSQLDGASKTPRAALFDSVPGVEKTREMRTAENAYLRKHATPRRSPPSKHVTIASMDVHDLAMQKAALLQDDVHDGFGMRPVMMGQHVSSWRNAGEYNSASSVQPARIAVSPDTGTPLLTSLHELGHHVDLHLDPQDVAAVVKAALASSSADWIENYVSKNKEYYLSPDELFARAYAQYIALKSGDPEVLTELQKVLDHNGQHWKYWEKSDWIPIEEAITKALKRRTWL